MKLAIIGAGFSGLSLAYFLTKKGYGVSIYEKDSFAGGLASGFRFGDWYLDKFYHHIFQSDKEIINLTNRLGLANIWLWKKNSSPVFYQGKVHCFSTPIDLLRFSPLNFKSRVQTGLTTVFLKACKNPSYLDKYYALEWLEKYMGRQSVKVIWKPLLIKKFGKHYKSISASWIAARICKRTSMLGYPKRGFQIIINKLVNEIKKNGGKICFNHRIDNLNQLKSYDKVVFTGSNQQLLKLAPKMPKTYQLKLNSIKSYGTVVLLLILKRPLFNKAYWLNINDLKIPFVGCIQQTNLVNAGHYKNLHPVYLVKYLSKDSKIYKQSNNKLFDDWVGYLKTLNSIFTPNWVKSWYVYKKPYTQPIFEAGSKKHILNVKTPIKNLYLVNMSQIFPWDRGVNDAVSLAKKSVNDILF
jgi:protoporphyrinogen oxidase